jgi:hypothetical protein
VGASAISFAQSNLSGRAWLEETVVGLGKELYEFWDKYLRLRGYRLKVYIVISLAECWATLA